MKLTLAILEKIFSYCHPRDEFNLLLISKDINAVIKKIFGWNKIFVKLTDKYGNYEFRWLTYDKYTLYSNANIYDFGKIDVVKIDGQEHLVSCEIPYSPCKRKMDIRVENINSFPEYFGVDFSLHLMKKFKEYQGTDNEKYFNKIPRDILEYLDFPYRDPYADVIKYLISNGMVDMTERAILRSKDRKYYLIEYTKHPKFSKLVDKLPEKYHKSVMILAYRFGHI